MIHVSSVEFYFEITCLVKINTTKKHRNAIFRNARRRYKNKKLQKHKTLSVNV